MVARRETLLTTAFFVAVVFLVFVLLSMADPQTVRALPTSTTRYVALSGNDNGGANPCTGSGSPCRTVQQAVDQAGTGDTILVATGVYTNLHVSGGNTQVVYIGKSVTIRGGYTSTDWSRDLAAYPTTLDADRQGRVIYIIGAITPTIDGLVITGGDAGSQSAYPRRGGGIFGNGASPIIQNNVITDNTATTISETIVHGGGIAVIYGSSSTLISGNLIVSNTAWMNEFGSGGGLFLSDTPARVVGNEFRHNFAQSGGGVFARDANGLILEGNIIISNTITSVHWAEGGGIFIEFSNPFTLVNNVIAQNNAGTRGGGILFYYNSNTSSDTAGVLLHNTIAQNDLGSGGEGIFLMKTALTLTNNIIVSNSYGIYCSSSNSAATARTTLLYGNSTGDTGGSCAYAMAGSILGSDPLFVGAPAGDYHVAPASPAVDSGAAAFWVRNDRDGNPRPDCSRWDVGAYEVQGAVCYHVQLPLVLRNSP